MERGPDACPGAARLLCGVYPPSPASLSSAARSERVVRIKCDTLTAGAQAWYRRTSPGVEGGPARARGRGPQTCTTPFGGFPSGGGGAFTGAGDGGSPGHQAGVAGPVLFAGQSPVRQCEEPAASMAEGSWRWPLSLGGRGCPGAGGRAALEAGHRLWAVCHRCPLLRSFFSSRLHSGMCSLGQGTLLCTQAACAGARTSRRARALCEPGKSAPFGTPVGLA